MKKLLLLLATILVTLSCKKEEELIHATIIYSNTIPGEGCGWLLTVDNMMAYSPNNLDSAFMINNLPVLVSFDETGDSTSCGFGANVHYPIITILEMKNH